MRIAGMPFCSTNNCWSCNFARQALVQKFFKDLKAILQGKGTSMNRRNVMQTLGSCYTYMEEFDSLFSKIGLNMHIMKPQTILEMLGSMDAVCRNQLFSNGNAIMDSLETVSSPSSSSVSASC